MKSHCRSNDRISSLRKRAQPFQRSVASPKISSLRSETYRCAKFATQSTSVTMTKKPQSKQNRPEIPSILMLSNASKVRLIRRPVRIRRQRGKKKRKELATIWRTNNSSLLTTIMASSITILKGRKLVIGHRSNNYPTVGRPSVNNITTVVAIQYSINRWNWSLNKTQEMALKSDHSSLKNIDRSERTGIHLQRRTTQIA